MAWPPNEEAERERKAHVVVVALFLSGKLGRLKPTTGKNINSDIKYMK